MKSLTDSRPELKYIKVTSLYIPTDYQRSTKSRASQNNIAKIKNDFNWAQFGALVVCPLKGSKPPQFGIIDGQHRYNAALSRGDIQELPCVVIEERMMIDQAKSFIAINEDRVPLHLLHKYQAMITAGDQDALTMQAILKKCSITIASHAFTNADIPPRCTMAIGSLLKMMGDYTEKQMVWALSIIPEAYGDKPGMLTANMIKVMAKFIKDVPGADRGKTIEVLKKLDIDTLKRDALAYRKIEGGTTVTAMFKVIEKRYNRK